ncbi:MAG: DUF2628 domain-containing protein [Alphaproteobacteria bacterium]
MARLKLYTVHLRTWSAAPDREAVLVREGFCWPAFFFSVFWALWHRMWFAAAGLLALTLGLAVLHDILGLDDLVAEAIGLAAAVLVGFEANDWRRDALRRRGYAEAGVVAATDREAAEHQFFSRRAAPAA